MNFENHYRSLLPFLCLSFFCQKPKCLFLWQHSLSKVLTPTKNQFLIHNVTDTGWSQFAHSPHPLDKPGDVLNWFFETSNRSDKTHVSVFPTPLKGSLWILLIHSLIFWRIFRSVFCQYKYSSQAPSSKETVIPQSIAALWSYPSGHSESHPEASVHSSGYAVIRVSPQSTHNPPKTSSRPDACCWEWWWQVHDHHKPAPSHWQSYYEHRCRLRHSWEIS